MATAKIKAKKPAVKAKAARPVKAAAKPKTPISAARPKKVTVKVSPSGPSQTAQLLTVIFALLALIFLAVTFYAYS